MKAGTLILIVVVWLGLPISSSFSQENIQGLRRTGVDDTGEVLPSGEVDAHYALEGPVTPAIAIDKNTRWVSPPEGAKWIGPSQGDVYDPVGVYVYTIKFDLTGLDVSSAVVSGQWTADNYASILLNGVDTGFSVGDRDYGRLFNFTIDSGFVIGVNELQFVVNNSPPGDNPTGLLVAEIDGVAYPPVPVKASTWGSIKSLFSE